MKDIWIQKENGIVHVKSSKVNPLYQTSFNTRYVTSCCGKGRQGLIRNKSCNMYTHPKRIDDYQSNV
nr:hypothetical protein [Bacillus cereus]